MLRLGPATGDPRRASGQGSAPEYPGHGQGITEFVERVGADLVVLGTRGRTNLRDMLFGSTAERVVRDAPCSILAVKPDGAEPLER